MDQQTERLANLVTAPNEGAAGIIRATLAADGIRSWQHSDSIFLGVWGAAGFHPTTVRVRESDLERAKAAIATAQQDSVDIDWAEVDVGEPEDEIARRIAQRDGSAFGDLDLSRDPQRASRPRAILRPLLVWVILIAIAYAMTGVSGAPLVLVCAGVDVSRRLWLRLKYSDQPAL